MPGWKPLQSLLYWLWEPWKAFKGGSAQAVLSVLRKTERDCASLLQKSSADQPLYSSSLWGPVADGQDCVAEGLWLPQLHVGDWLVFENMGAYTVGMASLLGGTQTCRVTYAMSRVAW